MSSRAALLLLVAVWGSGCITGAGGAPGPGGGGDDGGIEGDGSASPDAGVPGTASCQFADDAPLLVNYLTLDNGLPPGTNDGRFLTDDCSLEVVVGQKVPAGPQGSGVDPALRARGLRVGFVVDLNGQRIRDMLAREDGVAKTVQDLQAYLASGYDYIIIDEITAHPDWADTATVSQRFRAMLDQLPPRKVIGYVSIDLATYANGATAMNARGKLLAALIRRGRAIGIEAYLHTQQAVDGGAPALFSGAASRVYNSIAAVDQTLAAESKTRAITVIGMSMHSAYPQYNYLDLPVKDLASVRKQKEALAAEVKTQMQRGVGFYFVNRADITPVATAPYTFDDLVGKMQEVAQSRIP